MQGWPPMTLASVDTLIREFNLETLFGLKTGTTFNKPA
jgi:hypothetical protein